MKIGNSIFSLKSCIVILTSGSGLLGSELLKELPKYGAQVIVGSRDTKEFKKKINNIEYPENTVKPVTIFLDIGDSNSIKLFFKKIEDRFFRIDGLINNAWPKTGDWLNKFEDVAAKSLYRNLCDHAGGYFLCCQKATSIMKKQKSGVILNIGSIYGEIAPHFSIYDGTDMTCPGAYPLIKGGIHAFTKYLATYLAPHQIRVNCLSPGGILNKEQQHPDFVKNYVHETPMGRMGNPDDIIGPVIFFLSKASKYITGQILFIDGGWTCW